MTLNLAWLDDFLVLAESGNFSRAADERHITQPAFSRRIRALEEWLGVELFDRSAQPARLTEAGRWLRLISRPGSRACPARPRRWPRPARPR